MAQIGIWEAILLGIVQGITEWLPISSSGHLILTRELLDVQAPVSFDLLVHVASLLVVLWVYRARLWHMLQSLPPLPHDRRQQGWKRALWNHPDRRMILLLTIGTLPIVVAGLLLEPHVEALFASTTVAATGLIATGVLLSTTYLATGERAATQMRAPGALLTGFFQALAILPGISRSGSTIAGARIMGLDKRDAADFAFLLAIPAIAGATTLQIANGDWRSLPPPTTSMAGFLATILVGYVSLDALLRLVRRTDLWVFAPYCFIVGVMALWLL